MKPEIIRLLSASLLFAALPFSLTACNKSGAKEQNTATDSKPIVATDDQPIFEDMTSTSGIDFAVSLVKVTAPLRIRESVGHGAALIDYDQDGLLDIVLLGPDSVKIYHNDGNWKFTDVTAKLGLRQKGYWQGIGVGDYDNDGYPDIYVCGYDCSALYHNEKGQGFKETTEEAGLVCKKPDADGNPEWRTSAAFVDVDHDGKLDLFVGRYAKFGPKTPQLCNSPSGKYSCAPEMYKGQIGSLYRNLGSGHFRDETQKRGFLKQSGHNLGIAIADYNGDGKIDIALANDGTPGNLFENDGTGHFTERGADSGTAYDTQGKTHAGMGLDFGDYDNDGKIDLFVTTYEDEVKTLYRNMGMGVFKDESQRSGVMTATFPWVSWGTKFIDYDADGFLDIVLTSGHVMDNAALIGKGRTYTQPLLLYHNEGGKNFSQVPAKKAGKTFETPIVGRAICLGDIDNDGQQDLLISNMEGKPFLLRNRQSSHGHWLGLRLIGKQSNRDGIGSEVRLEAGILKLVRTASTTGSLLSASDPRVHFGLGTNTTVTKLTIRWPGGKVDTFNNVPTDRYLVATEGSTELVSTPQPSNQK